MLYFLKCCGHIASSKAQVTKRKEAQKLAQWTLTKISEITNRKSSDKSLKSTKIDELAALESAFGSLDAKLN